MAKIVKNTTMVGPLDLLFPHTCRGCGRLGAVVCDCCKKYILDTSGMKFECEVEREKEKNGAKSGDVKAENGGDRDGENGTSGILKLPAYAAGEREGLLDTIIHEYKYQSVRAISGVLAEVLQMRFREWGLSELDKTVLVPLPTATNHIRSRGFDHMRLVAKKLARVLGCKMEMVLTRQKNTVQVGADGNTRVSQAEQAYAVRPGAKLDPEVTYVLLDDVWTTGASMKAAAKKLLAAGAKKVIIIVIAKSKLKIS